MLVGGFLKEKRHIRRQNAKLRRGRLLSIGLLLGSKAVDEAARGDMREITVAPRVSFVPQATI